MCEWKPTEFFQTMYATLAYADSEAWQKYASLLFQNFAKNATKNQPRFYQMFRKQIVLSKF